MLIGCSILSDAHNKFEADVSLTRFAHLFSGHNGLVLTLFVVQGMTIFWALPTIISISMALCSSEHESISQFIRRRIWPKGTGTWMITLSALLVACLIDKLWWRKSIFSGRGYATLIIIYNLYSYTAQRYRESLADNGSLSFSFLAGSYSSSVLTI